MQFFATCALSSRSSPTELALRRQSGRGPRRRGVPGFTGVRTGRAWSRVASRVLLPRCARSTRRRRQALYAGVQRINWNEHLDPRRTLAVDCSSTQSAINHSHYAALKTKDAIVDQLRARRGARPNVDVDRPDVRVNVYLHRDSATVSIDLSGESQHRRGYRARGAPAPLKENLAAAVLLLADWPKRAADREPLLDPMCGSGTFLTEAAQIAGDVAPGLGRAHFGCVGWASRGQRCGRDCAARPSSALAPARSASRAARCDVIRARCAPRRQRGAGSLADRIRVEKRRLADAPPEGVARGLVANRPTACASARSAARPVYAEPAIPCGTVSRLDRLRAHRQQHARQRIGLRPARRITLPTRDRYRLLGSRRAPVEELAGRSGASLITPGLHDFTDPFRIVKPCNRGSRGRRQVMRVSHAADRDRLQERWVLAVTLARMRQLMRSVAAGQQDGILRWRPTLAKRHPDGVPYGVQPVCRFSSILRPSITKPGCSSTRWTTSRSSGLDRRCGRDSRPPAVRRLGCACWRSGRSRRRAARLRR